MAPNRFWFSVTICIVSSCCLASAYATLAIRTRRHAARNKVGEVHKRSVENETMTAPVVQQFHVTSTTNMKFSETNVKVGVLNPASSGSEVIFSVQLPEEAFISNFTMKTADEFYVAEVLPKDEAEKLYEDAKKNQETTGLVSDKGTVQTVDRTMTLFALAVNLEANSTVYCELVYQQVLLRVRGTYEYLVGVSPDEAVEDFNVEIFLFEPQGISSVTVGPPYSGSSLAMTTVMESQFVRKFFFKPSVEDQLAALDDQELNPIKPLSIHYDVMATPDDGYVVMEDEFFAYYFSPNETLYQPLPKTVLFVIDISGSMSGLKMEQTKSATLEILSQLRPVDKFMLLLFDDRLDYWPSEKAVVLATPSNVEEATAFAKSNLKARGGTDINQALTAACERLSATNNEIGSNLILFLTDGDPTAGEISPPAILQNIEQTNGGRASIFSLGFGNNVNFDLLESISYSNYGFPKKIYEGVDATLQLQDFYKEIGDPLMYDILFSFGKPVLETSGLYFPQYFAGSEIMIVGKLAPTTDTTWSVDMKRSGLPVTKITKTVDSTKAVLEMPVEEKSFRKGFLERLFAHFKIKDILKQRSASTLNETVMQELSAYAERLALDYHLVTPLTSLVIVKDLKKPRDTFDKKFDLSAGIHSTSKINYASSSRGHSTVSSAAFFVSLSFLPCLLSEKALKLI